MQNSEREYDVVIWGATGFTGALVARYLFNTYGPGSDLKWALGGRNREKLEAVRREIGDDQGAIPIVTGDSHDAASLNKLTQSTTVICSTVGPYAKYGSELVAACVRNGTHYCDLSGEPQWMREMIDAHHNEAQASGARIVHSCGFDSIPSDLGVLFLQTQAEKQFGKPCSEIKLRVKAMKGGPSGGTVASMLSSMEAARQNKTVARVLRDPYGLNPEGERQGPDRRDQMGVRYDADFKAWTMPFIMAQINTRIVRRSNALMNYRYGQDFRYSESTLTGSGPLGYAKAMTATTGMAGFMVLAGISPTRAALEKFLLPSPGEGPSPEQQENGFFCLYLMGKLSSGESISAKVTGDRDPGYGSTSRMLGEAAVCLALDTLGCEGGFWTPASAMGDILIARLTQRAGLTFELRT